MFREKCRQRGIPLLVIDYDLSDTRVVPPAGIRRQVELFMETIARAERLVEPPAPNAPTRSRDGGAVLQRLRRWLESGDRGPGG
jgi:hypothetical protein